MVEQCRVPRFTPVIESLPDTIPFVAPEELERNQGKPFIARLGANESAFGISPLAVKALQQAMGTRVCSWYGDPLSFELRTALAEHLTVAPEQLCVDAGIDSLLGLTVRLFMQPGDTLVTSAGAYPTVSYHAAGVGAAVKTVPYKNNHEDTIALARTAQECNARLVYLANPDNPMGTQVGPNEIEWLIRQLPQNCLLLLDEAYVEFMCSELTHPLHVVEPNVVRFRTFSKAFGMAGMRIGYAIADQRIIKGYDKIRNHFGVNRLAQVAALASLSDAHFLDQVLTAVECGRQQLYKLATSLELPYEVSATNFVAVDLGTRERADKLLNLLANHGIFMRKPMQPPLDRYLRMGVGNEEEQRYLSKILPTLMPGL